MELVIGGKNQGKLSYVLGMIKADTYKIDTHEAEIYSVSDALLQPNSIINNLQEYIKQELVNGKTSDEIMSELKEYININPKSIIICDEVGCGLVPMEKSEREYREAVGRICCEIAKNACKVHRVICGIGVIIKNA